MILQTQAAKIQIAQHGLSRHKVLSRIQNHLERADQVGLAVWDESGGALWEICQEILLQAFEATCYYSSRDERGEDCFSFVMY